MGRSSLFVEFLIVLLRFTLFDKLNNELEKGWKGSAPVCVKINVNWRFIDSLINLELRQRAKEIERERTEPHVEQLFGSSREKPLEGDATVG